MEYIKKNPHGKVCRPHSSQLLSFMIQPRRVDGRYRAIITGGLPISRVPEMEKIIKIATRRKKKLGVRLDRLRGDVTLAKEKESK